MGAALWRWLQVALLTTTQVAIILVAVSASTTSSVAVLAATKSSKSALSGETDSVLIMGIVGFCKKNNCASYRDYATSPAAKAAAKHLNDTKTSVIENDQKLTSASINSPAQESKTKVGRDKVQLSNLEKVAVVCVSGTGSNIMNRPWTTLPVILIISAVLTLLLTTTFGFLAHYDRETRIDENEEQMMMPGNGRASSSTALRYALTGAQLVNLAILIAAFAVTMVPFSKAKGKFDGKASWGLAFAALVYAMLAVLISAFAEGWYTAAKLTGKNRLGQGHGNQQRQGGMGHYGYQ